jgi:hypothetical protein
MNPFTRRPAGEADAGGGQRDTRKHTDAARAALATFAAAPVSPLVACWLPGAASMLVRTTARDASG